MKFFMSDFFLKVEAINLYLVIAGSGFLFLN
jgi:hypothetical protein